MLWTKAVSPQVVGDGRENSEPGQEGEQKQGGQLVDGMPDERHAHHQPVEQQQVQQGLGRGRVVRQAALRPWPRPVCCTLDPEPRSWGSVHSPGAQSAHLPCRALTDLLCHLLLGPGGLPGSCITPTAEHRASYQTRGTGYEKESQDGPADDELHSVEAERQGQGPPKAPAQVLPHQVGGIAVKRWRQKRSEGGCSMANGGSLWHKDSW